MRLLKRIPDAIIISSVIVGAIALGAGYRIVGATSMLIAVLFAWKRNWRLESFEGLMGSGGNQSANLDDSPTDLGDEAEQ